MGAAGDQEGFGGVSSLTCLTSLTQVNRTFRELAVLGELGGAWQELGPRIYTLLNSSLEMQVLQVCDPRLLPLGTGMLWGARWGVLGCNRPGVGWDGAGAGGLHGLPHPGALQDLLLAPSTAQLLDGFLNGTSWKLPDLATFLVGPAGGPDLTWHQVYADVDAVLSTLSQFMEVCVTPVLGSWPLVLPVPSEPYLPPAVCLPGQD